MMACLLEKVASLSDGPVLTLIEAALSPSATEEQIEAATAILKGCNCANCQRNGLSCFPVEGGEVPEAFYCTSWLADPQGGEA